jgi:DNA transformation protein and related proteins
MPKRSEFVDYLLELLAPLRGVQAKSMFGGYGIYQDGLMFGLVANDVLYLKTDEGNRAAFEARGLPPFTYERTGKPAVVMSYHRTPEEALEESEELCRWARDACAAARRNANRKPSRKKNPAR